MFFVIQLFAPSFYRFKIHKPVYVYCMHISNVSACFTVLCGIQNYTKNLFIGSTIWFRMTKFHSASSRIFSSHLCICERTVLCFKTTDEYGSFYVYVFMLNIFNGSLLLQQHSMIATVIKIASKFRTIFSHCFWLRLRRNFFCIWEAV